jgi:hypothetical protein
MAGRRRVVGVVDSAADTSGSQLKQRLVVQFSASVKAELKLV